MPSANASLQSPRVTQLELLSPRTVLAALLLVLLSGLPQIGISLTKLDFAGERMTALPATRSILIDKLLPEAASLTPPHVSDFPPALVVPPPLPFLHFDGLPVSWEEPVASPWRQDLTRRLYRHHSSYV